MRPTMMLESMPPLRKAPSGDIGDHVAPDGFIHRLEEPRLLFAEPRLRAVRKPFVIDVPVLARAELAAAEAQGLPRQELADVSGRCSRGPGCS